MVLFAMGGLFSIFEDIEKVRRPHEVESLGWALGVLIFAITVEAIRLPDGDRRIEEAQR